MFSTKECAKGLQELGRALNGSREICAYCGNDITDLDGVSCPKCGASRDECKWVVPANYPVLPPCQLL
jgi:predicted amidophosphoribosyltransferase